ncbi:hypothetical protein KC352_g23862, partial [Hortaea werneckii]
MASGPVIEQPAPAAAAADAQGKKRLDWKAMLGARHGPAGEPSNRTSMSDASQLAPQKKKDRWNMGIMNDPDTDEVPGSILLLSKVSEYN